MRDDDRETELIDVSGLSLRDLDAADESSLAHALRRLLSGDDARIVLGFNSAIGDA